MKEEFGSKRLSVIIDMKGRGRTAFWQAYEGLRAASTTLVLPGSVFHLIEFSAFQLWALLDVPVAYVRSSKGGFIFSNFATFARKV